MELRFSIIRSGTHHPNAANVCNQSRIISLTRNITDLLPDRTNVEIAEEDQEPTNIPNLDPLPNLVPHDDPMPPLIRRNESDDFGPTTDAGLEYVAGYICKQLKLTSETQEITDNTSWLGRQNYRSLKKPKESFVEKIRFLDEKFDLLHPYGKLKHGPYMLDRTIIYLTRAATEENIKISQRVIQMFSKTRFFHSLRMMQKDINSMNKKSVREYKQIGQHST